MQVMLIVGNTRFMNYWVFVKKVYNMKMNYKKKLILYRHIKANPDDYLLLPPALQQEEKFVLRALKGNGLLMQKVPEIYRSHEKAIWIAITQNPMAFEFIAEEKKRNKNILTHALSMIGSNNAEKIIQQLQVVLNDKVRGDHVFMSSLLDYVSYYAKPFLPYVLDEKLKQNKIFMSHFYHLSPESLKQALPIYRNDKEIITACVRRQPSAIRYASEDLRHDKKFIESLAEQYSIKKSDMPEDWQEDMTELNIHNVSQYIRYRLYEDHYLILQESLPEKEQAPKIKSKI